jgi:hypothetical protein
MSKNEKHDLHSCMVDLNQPVLAPISDPTESDGSITPGIVNGIVHVIVQVTQLVKHS